MRVDMKDRLEIENSKDIELKKSLEKIDWLIDYGNVKLQIREGHVTMIAIERTIKMD